MRLPCCAGSPRPRPFATARSMPRWRSSRCITGTTSGAAERGLPTLRHVRDVFGAVAIEIVRIPHDCTDGFFGAYWRRPDAYLERGVRASISALTRLGETAVRPALERLA